MTKRILLSGLLGLFLSAALRADALDDDLASAKSLLIAGKVDEAAARLNSLEARARVTVAANAGDAHAQYILGMAALYAGHDPAARTALDLALRLDPGNALYALGRAQFALYTDKPKDAIPILQKVLEKDAKNMEALSSLGEAQDAAALYADAQQTYQKIADLQPREAQHLAKVAAMLVKQEKTDDALAAYQKALELNPKYAQAWADMGQIYENRKDFDRAVDAYNKVAAINADDYRPLARVMQLLEAQGKTQDRDVVRARILALFKAGKTDSESFCREQFPSGQSNVMVFEYFELQGPAAVRYAFNVVNPDGKTVEKRVSLGSYLDITAQARETGQIKPTERLFHLDVYTADKHDTLALLPKEPTYEETRDLVKQYLAGTLKPLPASAPANGGGRGGGS